MGWTELALLSWDLTVCSPGGTTTLPSYGDGGELDEDETECYTASCRMRGGPRPPTEPASALET